MTCLPDNFVHKWALFISGGSGENGVEDASGLMSLLSLGVTSECVWVGERKGSGCVSTAAAQQVKGDLC